MTQKEEIPNLRKSILDTATHLFITGGYHGFSMRQIAEEFDISKPAIYYHFTDKDDLILAVLVRSVEAYKEALNDSLDGQMTSRQKLTRFVNATFDLSPEIMAAIQVSGQEITHLSPHSRQVFNDLYHKKFIDKITAIISQGIRDGEIRNLDPVLVTRIFLGMVSPFFHLPAENCQSAAELTLSIFFDGVSPHA